MSKSLLLLVDDEPSNLAVLRQVLADHYSLAFANSGTKAIEAARKLKPALILLDIQMPDTDGYAVCRQLKADPGLEHIPVIFITSLAEVGDEARGFEVGAVDYITKPISPSVVQARVRTHLSLVRGQLLEQSYYDAISMLGAAGHYNDNDTGLHIWRMAAYASALAKAADWCEEDCQRLETAAPMHDTGKIGIPGEILRKPAALDADEWEVMKTHCRLGHTILSMSAAPVFKMAAEVALRHHEKWDGNGYPDGLAGEAIPESARIVAVADVFDALTMKRPYKEPWPVEKAIDQIHAGSGSHFEPRLVTLFTKILPELLAIRARWEDEGGRELSALGG